MLSTSTTITGPCAGPPWRAIMPPLMKPGSVGPLSPLGPDVTIVYFISGISCSCQPKISL
jgi:hypothetical protein